MAGSFSMQSSISEGLVRVCFRFQSAGAATNAPDFVVPTVALGPVASITHASTGVYAVTLSTKFPVFVGGHAVVMPNSAAILTVPHWTQLCIADYVPSTGVLTVRNTAAAATTDSTIAATIAPDNDWIFCDLVFAMTNAQGAAGAV